MAELLQDDAPASLGLRPRPGPGRGADRLAGPDRGEARRVVGDADVFSAFAGEPDALRGAAVLTPHAGEFARVFGAPATIG